MSISTLEQELDAAWRVRQAHFSPQVTFTLPLDTALISLTGAHCVLQCAHCAGHYLRHMQPIQEARVENAPSVLISGGCDPDGCVPVADYLEQIETISQGRRLNWHVGLIDEPAMQSIAPYVDTISFDVVGDVKTIRGVYGLDKTPQDYADTYAMLRQYARVVPHITIGLLHGQLGHERPALEMLAQLDLDAGEDMPALVFIVFIPTPGTRYADYAPPQVNEVALLLAQARQRFPKIPIHLGCMRPRGQYRAQLDPLAVRAGVNVLVSPSRQARETAKQLGLQVLQRHECCVFD
ncbi:MAG: radical SAM protein [Anaerolineae bacterium]|nr:radical SAM protein [Anaerolineae bacterium]